MIARPFKKLLVANRGEIACRIIRTARRMGIETVAIHSEADLHAMHVRLADKAQAIGPAPARESYLSIDRIMAAARASGAEAIHPGYGFLSENADFAVACGSAGLVFVGPPASAMRAMGSKSAAKDLMAASGVPLLPGYHGEKQDIPTLAGEAAKIGYPVLIKASAGGGGKGMRIVNGERDLAAAVESAKREASSAFGDDRVLIEKYLNCPRHIEVQVFGDTHGNVVSLFERDCTLQRRHQKVIEEAPSASITQARRQAMMEAARSAARAVHYAGAGTVEFISDEHGFYFIEMNTRLQVEHPVTEMITGLDLVEWQLRVAAGEALPMRQEQIAKSGHAIECRIYAEDPERGFLPSGGKIELWQEPARRNGVRVDAGYGTGDMVPLHYDPMLAKLVAWDADRGAALRKMAEALGEFEIVGVFTNLAFLQSLLAQGAVRNDEIDTGLIERELDRIVGRRGPMGPWEFAATAAALLTGERDAAEREPPSPWLDRSGWTMAGERKRRFTLHDRDGNDAEFAIRYTRNGLFIGTQAFAFDALPDHRYVVTLGGEKTPVFAAAIGASIALTTPNGRFRLSLVDPFADASPDRDTGGHLVAPMPGMITLIHAAAGALLERGAPIITMEAMKMEFTLKAPAKGKLIRLNCSVGDFMEENTELADFEVDS